MTPTENMMRMLGLWSPDVPRLYKAGMVVMRDIERNRVVMSLNMQSDLRLRKTSMPH